LGGARGRQHRSERPCLGSPAGGGTPTPRGARRGPHTPLLLHLRLVTWVNDRAAPPAGQERRSGHGGDTAVRDLPRLSLVASRLGADARRRGPAPLRLERRG